MRLKRILVEVDKWILVKIKIKRLIKRSSTLKTMMQYARKPKRTILHTTFLPQLSHQSLNQILQLHQLIENHDSNMFQKRKPAQGRRSEATETINLLCFAREFPPIKLPS